MRITNCRECSHNKQDYEKLSYWFLFRKRRSTNYFQLVCNQCGQVFCLSTIQCVVFYLLMTCVSSLFLLIDHYLIGILYLLVAFPFPFYIVWNKLPWKKVEGKFQRERWKEQLGFNIAFTGSILSSHFFVYVIFFHP